MKWLEFKTVEDTYAAMNVINSNIGLPKYNEDNILLADTWAYIFQTINNTFVFEKPDDEFMVGVVNYEVIDVDLNLLPTYNDN